MNKGVLTSVLLMGALASPLSLAIRAVGQENHQQQARNPNQNTHQDQNKHEEQLQHQLWNENYSNEETADRYWLTEQQQKHNNPGKSQYRSWSADYTYEETVDRNWLNEHNLD